MSNILGLNLQEQVGKNKIDIEQNARDIKIIQAEIGQADHTTVLDVHQVTEYNYDNFPYDREAFYGVTSYQNSNDLRLSFNGKNYIGNNLYCDRNKDEAYLYASISMRNIENKNDIILVNRLYSYVTKTWGDWNAQINEDDVKELIETLKEGPQGPQGVSVSSAAVNSGYDLILTLSDGKNINAGYVRGPQGVQGNQGLKGEKGADGNAFAITGYVSAASKLPTASEDYAGIAYGVGIGEAISVYVWDNRC